MPPAPLLRTSSTKRLALHGSERTTHNRRVRTWTCCRPTPADYVTSIYDEASRTMVLWGPSERIALAEDLIKRFEEKGSAGGTSAFTIPRHQA